MPMATFRVLAKGDVEADAALASEVGCPPALRSLTPAPGERSQSRGAVGAALPRLSDCGRGERRPQHLRRDSFGHRTAGGWRPVIDTRSICRARGCGPAPPGRTGSGRHVQRPVRRSPWSSVAGGQSGAPRVETSAPVRSLAATLQALATSACAQLTVIERGFGPGRTGRRSALRVETSWSGARGCGRAAGLSKYGGPTLLTVRRGAELILLVFLGRRELLCCTLGWI